MNDDDDDDDITISLAKEITDLLSVRLDGQEFWMVFAVLCIVLENLFLVANQHGPQGFGDWCRQKFIKGLTHDA